MDKISVHIDNKEKTYTAPSGWNDLTTPQLMHTYQIINAKVPKDGGIPLHEVGAKKFALLAPLFGLNLMEMLHLRRQLIDELGEEAGSDTHLTIIRKLVNYTDVFFTKKKDGSLSGAEGTIVTTSPTLTRNPWPQLKNSKSGKKYFGPRDNFENLTIYELGNIFTLFENYGNEGADKDQIANTMIATLWRPPKPDSKENIEKAYEGDLRLPLSGYEATIPARIKDVATLPSAVKKVIIFFVQSCLHEIASTWGSLFEKMDDEEEGTPRKKSNAGSMATLLIKLSNGLIHLDKIQSQPYENVFVYLDMLEKERVEAELNHLRNKSKRRR